MDRILWPRKVLNKAFLKVKHNRSQRFKLKNQTKFSNKKKQSFQVIPWRWNPKPTKWFTYYMYERRRRLRLWKMTEPRKS
jgi:hypothetical protein